MSDSPKLSLGQRLKQNIEEEQRAKTDAELAQARLKSEKERKEFADVKAFFDAAKEFFTCAIENNYPSKEIFVQLGGTRYYREPDNALISRPNPSSHFNAAALLGYGESSKHEGPQRIEPGARFEVLWLDMQKWASDNGLVVKWHYCYDGGGIESWWTLHVKAIGA